MDASQTEYRSYLLRLWRLGKEEPWHVMLEQVGSKERHTFANLEGLWDFLQPSQDEMAPRHFLSDGDDTRSDDEDTRR